MKTIINLLFSYCLFFLFFSCATDKELYDAKSEIVKSFKEYADSAIQAWDNATIIDFDSDGVADYFDRDKATSEGEKVYGDGTYIDIDQDGVPDFLDAEPFSTKGSKVEAEGRELDADADGIPDSRDLEPNTVSGTLVNFQGKQMVVDGSNGKDTIIVLNTTSKNLSTNDKIELLSEMVEQLRGISSADTGTYYLKYDSVMTCFEPAFVEAGIIKQTREIVLKMFEQLVPSGAQLQNNILVDEYMTAELIDMSQTESDGNFEITPKIVYIQDPSPDKFKTWEWTVRPLHSGNHSLKLVITIKDKTNQAKIKDKYVVEKIIHIKANPVEFGFRMLQSHWAEVIATSVIIPFVVWWYSNRKKRKKSKKK